MIDGGGRGGQSQRGSSSVASTTRCIPPLAYRPATGAPPRTLISLSRVNQSVAYARVRGSCSRLSTYVASYGCDDDDKCVGFSPVSRSSAVPPLAAPEENLGLAHLESRPAFVLRPEDGLADAETGFSGLCQPGQQRRNNNK